MAEALRGCCRNGKGEAAKRKRAKRKRGAREFFEALATFRSVLTKYKPCVPTVAPVGQTRLGHLGSALLKAFGGFHSLSSSLIRRMPASPSNAANVGPRMPTHWRPCRQHHLLSLVVLRFADVL